MIPPFCPFHIQLRRARSMQNEIAAAADLFGLV